MNREELSQSKWYKELRPEYFSDSEITYSSVLPREVLAYELEKISTNQKQDQFEALGRRLSEKFISPNLIPQVGPTGGGDGKTDTETYPVSEFISDRWYIPQNGWKTDEKWAFAISSKKQWKSKLKKDIINILETKREYTKIYFISNQKIASKKKKDAQDEFSDEFKIEVVILDGEWIIEKIFNNNLIDLAVDTLNLSSEYKNKKIKLGKNDAERIKLLEELENNINNPSRYFEIDFQLVEDSIEAAKLSRMLEKPRDEVEGKFDRAFRFCSKLNKKGQWIRLHYQKAWTYLNYYDDSKSFINEYKNFIKYIDKESSISEIELYINLFNLIRGLHFGEVIKLSDFKLNFEEERKNVLEILIAFEKDEKKPVSALIAKTYKAIMELMDVISIEGKPENVKILLSKLSECFKESKGKIEFPFESFKKQVEIIGEFMPNNSDYDNLIDTIADISQKRSSELNAGEIFLKRGGQKLFANYNKESIVYFGRAVLKLAKEETPKGLYLALIGLGKAYGNLGLIWASNNSLLAACSFSLKSWFEGGIIDKKALNCVEGLVQNELINGRIPSILTWNELYIALGRQLNLVDNKRFIETTMLIDGCLTNRLLVTDIKDEETYSYLPDILIAQELEFSRNALFYKLGQLDLIQKEFEIKFNKKEELDNFFNNAANQPFRKQIMYKTNFMVGNSHSLFSTILGCKFIVRFKSNIENLLIAETFLAFFESFLATSLSGIFPKVEEITINLEKPITSKLIDFKTKESSTEYICFIEKFEFTPKNHKEYWEGMIELITHIVAHNFHSEEPLQYIENLFKNEEINDRISFVFNHRSFSNNVLGDKPKLFANDWIEGKNIHKYENIRQTPVVFKLDDEYEQLKKTEGKPNLEQVRHDKRKVYSVIDDSLWQDPYWHGFGFIQINNFDFGIFIAFKNGNKGKKIFEKWIQKFGNEDKEEQIKITLIKGIDTKNPFWYKVVIGSNIKIDKKEDIEVYMASQRIHRMEPNNPVNIENLTKLYSKNKKYLLLPAQISHDGTDVEPFFDKGIIKRQLNIKNAWELAENDMEQVAITDKDNPIIPKDIDDAPILKILKNRKKNR